MAGLRRWLASDAGQITVLFLATRAVLYAFAGALSILVPLETRVTPFDPQLDVPWLRIWSEWDVGAYVAIARDGYPPNDLSRVSFFPFYSLLIRLAATLIPNLFVAGVVVSNGAFLVALLLLFRLTVNLTGDRDTAHRAVFYMAAYPAAFFTATAYSEAVFLATTIATFCELHRGRWLRAGAFGGMATATRAVGIVIAVPFVVEYGRRWHQRRWPVDTGVCGLLLIGLGVAGVTTLMWWQMGNPLAFISGQVGGFRRGLVLPWESLGRSFEVVAGQHLVPGFEENWATNLINLAATLLFLVLTPAAWRGVGPAAALYMAAGLLVPLSFAEAVETDRPLIAMVRFTMGLFPGFIVLAKWGRRPVVDRSIAFVFVIVLGLLTTLFVRSWNVAGVS